jgi:two-component system sensor histidine kinase KdpD
VTRLRAQREAAIRAQSRATLVSQSDQLKSSLLAAVSHDLRTPLAAIKTSATSLLDSSVEWDVAARADFLLAINEETDRLDRMVGNLLDLSRIESGILRPDLEWNDVWEVIEDVLDRHATAALDAGKRVSSQVDQNLPVVQLDYVEIAQVLTNLVENAIKHTPAGTMIEVTAFQTDDSILISVIDTGQGIAVEHMDRIFEPFVRSASSKAAGSGLGLAIARGFVEAHGGRIWTERQAEGGTAMRFTLPIRQHAIQNRRSEP